MRNKILITTSSFNKDHPELMFLSDRYNADIIFNPYGRRISIDELKSLITANTIGYVAGTETINADVLENASSLKVISRCGVGSDNVDNIYANINSISIYVTPDAPTQAVAELTIGLMLSALRNITVHNQELKSNSWNKNIGGLLCGKMVGIAGFGRVGQRVAKLLSVFGANSIFYDMCNCVTETAVKVGSMTDLVKQSDIISLHMPVNETNKHCINLSLLNMMKKNVILINTARGELINEDDLFDFLTNNPDAVAALDVYNCEPYYGSLVDLENTILTPHIASFTKESRMDMERQSLINLIQGLKERVII